MTQVKRILNKKNKVKAVKRKKTLNKMTLVNKLMIIWEKDGDKLGCGCVSPRGSYGLKEEPI